MVNDGTYSIYIGILRNLSIFLLVSFSSNKKYIFIRSQSNFSFSFFFLKYSQFFSKFVVDCILGSKVVFVSFNQITTTITTYICVCLCLLCLPFATKKKNSLKKMKPVFFCSLSFSLSQDWLMAILCHNLFYLFVFMFFLFKKLFFFKKDDI